MNRLGFATVILFFLGAGNGCGGNSVFTYPVEGIIQVDGRPAAGVSIVFHPLGDSTSAPHQLLPRGTSNESGAFRLSTLAANDGAPAGDYKVTLVWQVAPISVDPEENHPDEAVSAPNRLDEKYADPSTTPITVTVSTGPNRLAPIEAELATQTNTRRR